MKGRAIERANNEGFAVVNVQAITDPIRCAHDCSACDYTDRLFRTGGPRLKAQVTEIAVVHVSACIARISLATECRREAGS